VPIELFTNGSLLDENKVKRLYEANIRRLILSFQTPDKSSFAFRHAPVDFEEFLRKTEFIIENKFIGNYPAEIEIHFLCTAKVSPRGSVHSLETVDEIKEGLRIFERISRRLSREFRLDWSPERPSLNDIPASGERFGILPGVAIYFRHACLWNKPQELLGPGVGINKRERGYCSLPLEMLLILSNGDVTCCCMDYDAEIKLGNIKEKRLKDILSGGKFSRIKDGMKRAVLSEDACRRCQGDISGPRKTDILK
jgi:radical SAM protein with 4Fe4S-binding SPASM domain